MRVATTLGLVVLSLAAEGCGGSADCTDTATCAAPVDGSTGSDVVGVDVVASDSPAADSSSSGGDAGHMDSGSNDAMTIPDVVFIDSSTCPTGSQCVDAVPPGWSGPIILSDQTSGPPAPTPPACPSSYPTDVYDGNGGLVASPAQCTCSCGTITTGDCNNSTALGIKLYTSSGCAGTPCATDVLPYSAQGFCVGTGCTGALSAMVTPAMPQNDYCTPSLMKTLPPAAWSETARACQPTSVGGGCSAAQICVPTPPSPFSSQLCVFTAGAVACPTTGYTQQHTLYGSTSDSRSCSQCMCAQATGLTCTGGQVALATAANGSACAGTMQSIATDGSCVAVTLGSVNDLAWTTAPATISGTGSCQASGGTPGGSLAAAGPTTVCCQP